MWYVIQVMNGTEAECMQQFRDEVDIKLYNELFVPICEKLIKKSGKWIKADTKLFPGYIFIDTEPRYVSDIAVGLLKVSKFTKLLKSADEIKPITEEEEKYLKSIMDKEHRVKVSTGFLIGDRICITDGALRSYEGRVKKINRHKRSAEIEVNVFGRATTVTMGLEIISKISVEEFYDVNTNKQIANAADDESDERKKVRIIDGTFAGYEGRLEAIVDKGEAYRVELNIYGTPTGILFEKREVEIID